MTSFDKKLKFVSFDITNMYSNIAIIELIKIIELLCKQNDLNIKHKNDVIKMCKILTKQIIFSIKIHNTYKGKSPNSRKTIKYYVVVSDAVHT